jgi:hypothetical protein
MNMKSFLTKKEFSKRMKSAKESLLNRSMTNYTCVLIGLRFQGYESPVFDLYKNFIKVQLRKCSSRDLTSYKGQHTTEEIELLRYLLLDSFEQEVLSTYKFYGEYYEI